MLVLVIANLKAVLVYLIFFLSGIGGLIYQVLWVREFGNIFGNTIHSVSIVTGTFVLGLGVGGYLAGRWIDRFHRQNSWVGLTYYSWAELLIAIYGVFLAFLLPNLEVLSPEISSYVVESNGWFHLSSGSYFLRYLLAVILIGPMTFLMGATLTFLIRFLLANQLQGVGKKVGRLYGWNTAGAALGCLLVDTWAVPSFGLFATNFFAIAANFTAGILGLCWFRFMIKKQTQIASKINRTKEWPKSVSKPRLSRKFWLIGLSIFFAGVAGMGMEVIWFRFFSNALGNLRIVFSALLFVILLGMWFGSINAGFLTRFFGKTSLNRTQLYMVIQLLFVLIVLGSFYYFIEFNTQKLVPMTFATFHSMVFITVGVFVFLPAMLMGLQFPLANVLVQDDLSSVGRNAGSLYLFNAFGALTGSILAGFFLLPNLGVKNSIMFLCLSSFVALLPLIFLMNWKESIKSSYRLSLIVLMLVGTFSLGMLEVWRSGVTSEKLVLRSFSMDPLKNPKNKIVVSSEGLASTLTVTENMENGVRVLWIDGYMMSGASYLSKRYMRLFSHLPLLQIDQPESALVICFGVGNTLLAASMHPSMKNLEVVDISKNILQHAGYFSQWNKDVLKDPRVKVYINDGRQHLRMLQKGEPLEKYDLITLEPPPPINAGVNSLYSMDFYELVKKRLKKNGFVTQWWPAFQTDADLSRALIKSFVKVFPNAVLLSGARLNYVLIGRKSSKNKIDLEQLKKNLKLRPQVADDLKAIDLSTPLEIVGSFAASSKNLQTKLSNVQPVTDNFPRLEYPTVRKEKHLPTELFDVTDLGDWCPSCFSDSRILPELKDVPVYMGLQQLKLDNRSLPEIARIQFEAKTSSPYPLDFNFKELELEEFIESYGYLKKLYFDKR